MNVQSKRFCKPYRVTTSGDRILPASTVCMEDWVGRLHCLKTLFHLPTIVWIKIFGSG